jgi:polysaccharide deacetylase family protein (PEP-CTERM system associated)
LQPFHHFTVDVEEYFQVSALEPFVDRSQWDKLPSSVVRSTQRILELLDEHDARATFFVLGWIATRYPQLVREIAARGHEIASHGTDHRRVTQLSVAEFRESVHESKQILEQICGCSVLGFRAPSFSIVPGREWALDTLIEEGYVYDSSLFPIRRSGYGYPGTPRRPHTIERAAGKLLEFPPATLSAFGMPLPAGGGAYLRLLPYRLLDSAVAQAQRAGFPATVYIHPWELEPQQPRFRVSALTAIRHYGGLHRTEPRLHRLLSQYRFRALRESCGEAATVPPVPVLSERHNEFGDRA